MHAFLRSLWNRWIVTISIVTVTGGLEGRLHATDYRAMGLGELVESSSVILVVKVKDLGEKVDVKVEEALKGKPHSRLEFLSQISSFEQEGRTRRIAYIGPAGIDLNDLGASDQRVMFLINDSEERARTFHPACIQSVEKKERVMELLAMKRDPGPFTNSAKYSEDVDLIFLLGAMFHAFHLSAPLIPALEGFNASSLDLEELPWQHTRLTLRFTFQRSRKPMLQMVPFDDQGILPNFIRKIDAHQTFERSAAQADSNLPPAFEVTVNTMGPAKIGALSNSDAARFLRVGFQSDKLEVVSAANKALVSLMDTEAVSIAIEMLRHPDRKFRREAALFLSFAKDPSSVKPLCEALDDLPPCIRYSRNGYNEEDNQLSEAIGRAVRNLREAQTVPALKRAALKGYAGDWIAMTLSWLGDQTAFEPLLSHLRNPDVDHYPGELVTMIRRSNFSVEPWMKMTLSSDDYDGKRLRATKWQEWWATHETEFRIIRSWEEASRLPEP